MSGPDALQPQAPPPPRGLVARARAGAVGLTRRLGERLVAGHVRFNFDSVRPLVPAGSRLLDVGAWDGRLARLLRDEHGCEVRGLDWVAKNTCDVPYALVRSDGSFPLDDASFDVVTVMYVLHHARDDARVLAEAARVCRPGGTIIVGEDRVDTRGQRAVTVGFHLWLLAVTGMGWSGRFRTLAGWRSRFAAAGLQLAHTVELGPHMGKRMWPHNVLFVLRAPS